MGKFKPKAEQMFEEKVQWGIEQRDWAFVEETTRQFEAYLKLIEPMEAPSKELEFVGHNEPTLIEEQQALLSGEIHRAAEEGVGQKGYF